MVVRVFSTSSRLHLGDVIAFAAVSTLAAWWALGSSTHVDILLYDESNYLHGTMGGTPTAADGGLLYHLWYRLLGSVEGDRIGLYLLNYRLWPIAVPIAAFVCLRASRVPTAPALVAALITIGTNANLHTWPRISHFTIVLILMAMALAPRARTPLLRISLLALALGIASYARPELFGAFLAMHGILALELLRRKRQEPRRTHLPSALLIAATAWAMILYVGMPLGTGERSFLAFSQHFSINWVDWTGSTLSPWTSWRTIVAQSFGHVDSIAEAARSAPKTFARHIATNAAALPGSVRHLVRFDALWWYRSMHILSTCCLFAAARGVHPLASRMSNKVIRSWLALLCCLALPTGAAIFVIAPRSHYLIISLALLFVFAMVSCFGATDEDAPYTRRRKILLAGAAILAVAALAQGPTRHESSRPNLATITALMALPTEPHMRLLEVEGGYHIYVGNHVTRVSEEQKDVSFRAFVTRERINAIVVSAGLMADTRFADDPEFAAFVADPQASGFHRVSLAGADERYLLLADESYGSRL